MPGKTVRFNTPSPSHSVASLPEIDGSVSPQRIPALMLPAVDCQINPVLHHSRSSSSPIKWNMTCPVETALLHPSWAQSYWCSPATNPFVTHLVIIFGAWRIPVVPHPASTVAYVTVLDVLHGIYRYLRSTSSERNFQALSPDKQRRVTNAYNHRWQRCQIPAEREVEQKKGVKEIDFLADSTVFWGLSPTKELGTWQLQVSRS
ncbi:hypothetical protein F5050DRAFT_1806422 [Lentinula boryana]|uniref:DUF6699 domain-containing protein n=1 Tax=Lentinula boryana TaxID=40481 RepID=A0ABQ8QHK3_9AGAR|nr:hypothetical protein F5050DRAFT_1806422 [Lentinula boryana]